jgi:hypothetical protein
LKLFIKRKQRPPPFMLAFLSAHPIRNSVRPVSADDNPDERSSAIPPGPERTHLGGDRRSRSVPLITPSANTKTGCAQMSVHPTR